MIAKTSLTIDARVAAPARASRAYWVCQAVGWGTYLIVTLLQSREGATIRPGRAFEVAFAAAFGVLLTHLYRRALRARGWPSLDLLALVPRAVAAPVVLAVIFVVPLYVIEHYLLGDRPRSPGLVFLSAVVRWTMVFFIWEAIYLTVDLLRGRARAEGQRRDLAVALSAARLRSLESQLNPHFLFNALNTVRALIPDDPVRAQAAITQMASILRHSLGSARDNLVTLASELDVVEDYLAIESLRLGDRLRVDRSIEPGAAEVRIPAMLLQTLVENAVKHGISELREGGTLAICAKVEGGAMLLTVDNPRPTDGERSRSLEADNGVGLVNATERLRLLFGAEASLEMDLTHPRHATARVRLPVGA